MADLIEPFRFDVAQSTLDDLRTRLLLTRWPEQETVGDTSQGPQLAKIQALIGHWANGYDWRRCEAQLNGWGQHKTAIDGLGIHFLHIRSHKADALPLLLLHGWPGSVIEFRKLIGPLSDPAAHGSAGAQAFHLGSGPINGNGLPRGFDC